jgi:chromosomal replication initiator protein
VSNDLEHIWLRVQSHLARAVDESTYRIWLEPLRAVELRDGQLVVAAPTRTCSWIADRFGRVLQTCVAATLGPEVTVDLIACDTRRPAATAGRPHAPRAAPVHDTAQATGEPQLREPALNPKLTFEHFVIGDGNRLAHAAALAVAEMPSQAYNPLFICGPPGLGKTHLLHSIATFLAVHAPELDVRYTTGEAFTAQFLASLRSGSLDRFKDRYRHVDVLLVDDVQFLERKARTEEEFFHTFNELSDMGSQVVVTSDRLPRDLAALEDRLRERFEAGLVADIRPPDLATRMTILRKRVHHDNVPLTDPDALRVIAERVALNVRALEGALIRVVAYASLTDRPLSPELTCEVLDSLYPAPAPGHSRASVTAITEAACEHFGLTPEELLSTTRATRIAWPRQVAMYIARELTDESLPALGRQFGGRDHTTVLHAWRRTAERISKDEQARDTVHSLLARLTETPPDRAT